MTFISPQKDLCWICYIGLPKRYKQQPPFGVTIMRRGGGGGREEDNLQWTWFPSSGICNIFCHLVPQNLDKLQLDGLHGSGVELFKLCLSGKFFFPCVAIFNNLIIINSMYAALYPSYSSMETYFTFLLLYRVTKKLFLPFLRKKKFIKRQFGSFGFIHNTFCLLVNWIICSVTEISWQVISLHIEVK